MRAGSLNKKAVIQSIGSTVNDYGEIEEGQFTDFKTVWCSINPISGKEQFLSNTDFSKVTHKIKIRYTDGISASMRLVYDSRVFNFIHTKDVMERTKEIEILAWEQNNG